MIWFVPAVSDTVFVIVVHVFQPPVLGTLIPPVLSTPLNSTCMVPPELRDATRSCIVYVPVVATFTTYSSHSPAAVTPTMYAAPPSVVLRISTPSVRYCPP